MRKRYKRVEIHLTEEEHRHLKKQVSYTGLSTESFIRSLIMGLTLYPRPPDEYAEIRRQLAAIGNNINQIAARQHSHGFVDEPMLREAVASLQRMEREFTRAFAQES